MHQVENLCPAVGLFRRPDGLLRQTRRQRRQFRPGDRYRTAIILAITWGIVIAGNPIGEVRAIGRNTRIFLILSGIATGLSWLIYFKALPAGDVSFVAPIDKPSVVITIILSAIILKEPLNWRVIVGGMMIAGGSLVLLTK